MNQHFENKYAYYELKKEILHITFKPKVSIDYVAACMIIADRIQFQAYKDYAVICDVTDIKKIDVSARHQLALDGSLLIKAVALIARESGKFALASYYIALNKPSVITRVFGTVAEAEVFLTALL